MDAGIATENKLKCLNENAYRSLAVSRECHRQIEPSRAFFVQNLPLSFFHSPRDGIASVVSQCSTIRP